MLKRFSMSPKTRNVILACAVLFIIVALIIGLSLGLRKADEEDAVVSPEISSFTARTDEKKVKGYPASNQGKYRFASVATDTEICAQIGVDIMGRKKGTAVDAAIATMICGGAVHSQSSGIGGGHFAIIYQRPRAGGDREAISLIAREMAPAAAHKYMYVNDSTSSVLGGKAIGVPGELLGFYEGWSRYGNVDWEDLFHPTIRLLTQGFPVGKTLVKAVVAEADVIRNSPTLRDVFVKSDGDLVKKGDVIKDANLARTLQRIALDPFTFYNGSLARDIVADIADAGGIISEEDLRNYKAKFKETTKINLPNGGYTLYGVPPPSSGVVLQHIMQILDGYNFSQSDVKQRSGRSLTQHRVIEAFKFAFAKRSALGDQDFWEVTELMENMTSEGYAAYIRNKIDDKKTFNVSYYEPAFEFSSDSGTSHVSVIDQFGNAVGITSTVNLYFGSKVKGRRTGIVFNNEMDDFSTPGTVNSFGVPASPSNFIEPGKIPMSSMSPSLFVTSKGTPALVIGGSGGPKIITAIAQVAINNLWLGYDLTKAMDLPRLHHQLLPHSVYYESAYDKQLLADLSAKGHTLKEYEHIGVVGSIRNKCEECYPDCVDVYCIEAVADGRKGGVPDGF